ncbi:hypothetical protein CVT24_007148 [Panaeolus cyanescens]|uniref:L domain-like protein n=1 Tax=Panaeolus cyanescens TaxID=181874 RepID=A0A409YPH1_9AGAR|nr:hypothetical protein CVT24_007148 [Panaeolus cyanescens]
MSRIPQPSSSRTTSSLKPPSTPTRTRISSTVGSSTPTPSSRVRTQSSTARTTTPKPGARTPAKPKPVEEPPMPAPALSIKEAIALKRAEAKKAQQKQSGGGLGDMSTLEDALPDIPAHKQEEEDLLGRLPVRDTIDRARSTGVLNLATRSLPCLPSALFEIHLNITPDPLKSVTDEPVLPPLESNPRRRGNKETAWFEAQDLTVLKAWNNEITEIQHEISMFGSLKTVDLHKNKLTSLPNSFADLTSLTILDLSHNALTSLPENIWALPQLTTLNISHNQLTELPFNTPFSAPDAHKRANQYTSSSFFTPAVARAITPLPHLSLLDASHNKISANAIHDRVPTSLNKIDLSGNPLGQSTALLRTLGSLRRLKEARFEKAQIGDDSFPSDLFSSTPFASLRLLDLSETQVNLEVVQRALQSMTQTLNFDFANDEPPEGVTRVLVGKRIIKEAWEIELERRSKSRQAATVNYTDDWDEPAPKHSARSDSRTSTVSPTPAAASRAPAAVKPVQPKKEILKEAWEIEAEQGLLTEGGKRRARAMAAAAAASHDDGVHGSAAPPSPPPTSSSSGLSSPQYYNATSQTLSLPASAPLAKSSGHGRSFSVVTSAMAATSLSRTEHLSVPTPTLPLSVIVALPFASTLRVLNLSNRRMDKSFCLPSHSDSVTGFLPVLEELDLEGCNLGDLVQVYEASESVSGSNTPPRRRSEMVIPTLTRLFPSLRTLNLSYNNLSNASMTSEALTALILVSPNRRGLRHLRLRGNKITELDGLASLAEAFRGNRDNQAWKMEEIDVRDNEIGRLPAELGLLPLDVFLVDGNTWVPPAQ